jgi:hypothetical protein
MCTKIKKTKTHTHENKTGSKRTKHALILFLTMKRKYYPCTIFGYYNMVYLTRI